MTFQVIDDYLDPGSFQIISNLLLSSGFPYYYQSTVSYYDERDQYYFFNHHLYKDNKVSSGFFHLIVPALLEKLNPKLLIRAKINCFPREKENVRHGLHQDMDIPHLVGLWSANTNNGGTLLMINGEEKIIPSVANRMIVFDGNIDHTPISQTDEKIRVNVNINFN